MPDINITGFVLYMLLHLLRDPLEVFPFVRAAMSKLISTWQLHGCVALHPKLSWMCENVPPSTRLIDVHQIHQDEDW